ARHARAVLLVDAQQIDRGRAELESTAQYALRNNLDALAARAMTDLGQNLVDNGRVKDAAHWVDLAQSLWSRLGEPDGLGSLVFRARAALDHAAGDTDAFLADTKRGLAMAQRAEG